ncbi:MAG: hypothetical protein CL424_09110 [Acidimicrobiaceae bacterium]|nr:hypothetical protein [Acidimicrobiaceae bacterium]
MNDSTAPRIAPRTDDELDDYAAELVGVGTGADAPPAHNLIRTLAWNPGLLRRWIPWGGRLLNGGKLPPRAREVAILRIATRTGSNYEWSQHVSIGVGAGLTRDQVDQIAGDDATTLEPIDRTIIAAIDELVDDAVISEQTWSELAEMFQPAQLVELPMLVGAYMGIAYLTNSLRIAVEPGLESLPRRPDRS